jgi:hypothetical protein
MTVGDGGCRPGTAKTPSSADNGRPAVIHMLGRDGRSWRRPVRPGKISDGTAVPGRRTGRLRTLPLPAKPDPLLPAKLVSPLPAKPDPLLAACSQRRQIVREVRVIIPPLPARFQRSQIVREMRVSIPPLPACSMRSQTLHCFQRSQIHL